MILENKGTIFLQCLDCNVLKTAVSSVQHEHFDKIATIEWFESLAENAICYVCRTNISQTGVAPK